MKECSNCGISKNDTLTHCPLCGMSMSYSTDDGSIPYYTPRYDLLTEIEKIQAFSKKKRKGWPFNGFQYAESI